MRRDNYIYKIPKKRQHKYTWIISLVVVLYLLIVGAGWIVLKSPIFRFEKLNLEGNQKISNEKIIDFFYSQVFQGKRLNYFLGFQNFLIWPDEFKEEDLKFLPAVKSIAIRKNYIKKELTATIVEREPYGIWCLIVQKNEGEGSGEEECWMFDNEGRIFGRTAAAEGNIILSVADYSKRKIGLNSKIVPDAFVPNIFSVFKIIKQLELNVKKIEIADLNLREMKVSLAAGPDIYFSLAHSAQNEAQVIKAFMEKPDFHRLQYLDFRVENRLYYR